MAAEETAKFRAKCRAAFSLPMLMRMRRRLLPPRAHPWQRRRMAKLGRNATPPSPCCCWPPLRCGCSALPPELTPAAVAPRRLRGRRRGLTPLIYAIYSSGSVATVRFLLDRGADPNKAGTRGLTALHTATSKGSYELAELLLSKGAFVDPIFEKGAPLHIAAESGNVKMLELLLRHRADIGRMPVEIAATQGWKECVDILFPVTTPITRFADWNINGIIQHVLFGSSKAQGHAIHENDGSALKVKGDAAFQEKE